MNSFYRLYWKRSDTTNWSGAAYYENMQRTLDEYQRLYSAWQAYQDYDFKIIHTEITFKDNTKTTVETEYNPADIINDLSGGGS